MYRLFQGITMRAHRKLLPAFILFTLVARAGSPVAQDPATAPGTGNFNTAWAGFPKHLAARQKAFDTTKSKDKDAVVFLGDSLTEQAPLAKLFPDIRTANRGVSGDTTRGMLCRLEDNVLDLVPRAVVVLGGTNDMTQPGGDAAKTAENLKNIVAGIRAKFPAVRVFVLKTPPNAKHGPAFVKTWNTALEKTLGTLSGCILVDMYKPFLKPDGTLDNAVFLDGTHFKPAGYERYKQTLAPLLERL